MRCAKSKYVTKAMLIFSLPLSVSVLPGCTDQCDAASDSGFFETASGVMSGCYSRNDSRLMKQIQAQQSLNNSLQAMLDSLQAEQQALRSQHNMQQSEMQSLNTAWQNLKATLNANTQTNQQLQSQIDALQASMNDINQTPNLSESEKAAKLNTLRDQVQLLSEELANSSTF